MGNFWNSVVSFSLLATVCLSSAVTHRVRTSSGLIEGHASPQRPGVSEFLGIPYAQPPTGALRFARPVADCPANTGTTAEDYPGFTPQGRHIVQAFAQQLGTSQSEDCLCLNVWTGQSVSNQPKPVLVWIHGGRFTIGGSNSPYYDGQVLADEQDVVVVTFNYRMNIFGFPGAPTLPQNIGLLDQRLAIEWVHRNIAAFGGDPSRITIFGQSAGGASVDYYTYAWRENPLVSGLISHSGTALSFQPNTPEESKGYFDQVVEAVGCGDEESEGAVECLRGKPYQEILQAVAKVKPAESPALPQPVFHPTVDGPYLLTNNNNEAGYYRVSAFGANVSLTDHQWDQFNLAAFTCPTGATARSRAAHGVPTWQLRYFGDWDTLRLYPTSGAYHGVDLPMVFGTASKVSGLPSERKEERFAKYMAAAWVAFARDPEEGLARFGWPKFTPDGNTLVGLATGNSTQPRFFRQAEFEQGCAALGGDTTPGKGAF
ncbi:hypothetical protein FE257_006783 [Aspergillus nanangensis]|uniref:Carboxylic ester hydrolase n=1 Tax=Aspergillus nanangensis TaxID=2582783 RepID=A0AAD4CNT8_ASPNN|nr:hypothetical protein FE257_006783 [Aspergillus nanangensis]